MTNESFKLPAWLLDTREPVAVTRREGADIRTALARRPGMVIIGTSGSTDYLRDENGTKRFWPVTVSASDRGGDLAGPKHDERDEARRDELEEME